MRMLRASGVLVLSLWVTSCEACGALPFNYYVSEVETRLQSGARSQAVRSEVERWLTIARKTDGPVWGGAREMALNSALQALDLPAAGDPPLVELTPGQRSAKLHRLAASTLKDVDELGARKDSEVRKGARFSERRQELRRLYRQRDWDDVVTRGLQLQIDLGAEVPAKC